MLSLQQSGGSTDGSSSSGLVTIENSSPEVIHVVNVSSAEQQGQSISSLPNMHTITISGGSLSFPLNLVVSPSLSSGSATSSAQLITTNLPTDLATQLKEVNQLSNSGVGIIDVAARIKVI